MSSSELYLVMGCYGRRDYDFISCRGVENRILKISPSLEYYDDMCNYFEGLRLFDKPLFDINAIRHMLFNMQDRYDQKIKRLWTEQQFQLYEKFIHTHKMCGIYVRLMIGEEEKKTTIIEDKPVYIPAIKPIIKPKYKTKTDLAMESIMRRRGLK